MATTFWKAKKTS